MKTAILLAALALTGCGEPIPGTDMATAACGAYCAACGLDVPDCGEVCVSHWRTFAGFEDDRAACATGYLLARACQVAQTCDDPGCGDPYADMLRCADLVQ